jgi:hypothetical protein
MKKNILVFYSSTNKMHKSQIYPCIKVESYIVHATLSSTFFKGKVSQDFLLPVVFMNQFPPAPDYPIRTVSNFFENSQVKVHHWCQRHRWQILPRVSLVFLTTVVNLPTVSTILVANLPLVSTKPLANMQKMGTISGFRPLKVNYIYVNSTSQRCPNKIIKNFLIVDFSICHQCQPHQWCTLSRKYLREFSKKIEMAVMVYSGGWGKLIHEKNKKLNISWHCPQSLLQTFTSESGT